MVETPRLQASPGVWQYGRLPSYRSGPHSKYDLKVHLIWVPKYRKAVLLGPVALRVRDVLREIAVERELTIISGKVARDHVHLLIAHRPYQSVSQIVQWLKGISSRGLLEASNRWPQATRVGISQLDACGRLC